MDDLLDGHVNIRPDNFLDGHETIPASFLEIEVSAQFGQKISNPETLPPRFGLSGKLQLVAFLNRQKPSRIVRRCMRA